MKKDLETRLKELKDEYQKGQERLIALEQETLNLNNTMLRISGAIQVLQELLDQKTSKNSMVTKNDFELTEEVKN